MVDKLTPKSFAMLLQLKCNDLRNSSCSLLTSTRGRPGPTSGFDLGQEKPTYKESGQQRERFLHICFVC